MDEKEHGRRVGRPLVTAEDTVTRRGFVSSALAAGVALYCGEPASGLAPRHLLSSSVTGVSLAAKPWVYWFWFNGNVSREGITADLEAMHAIGIGGAIVMCSGLLTPGPVRYMSALWMDCNAHTLREAARLGLQIDLNNDDGWSDAAGPWMPRDLAMHTVTWSEAVIDGGGELALALPMPTHIDNFYRDSVVLAFPAADTAGAPLPAPFVTEEPGLNSYIVHDYGHPVTAHSASVDLWAGPEVGSVPVIFHLEASDEGGSYRRVYTFDNAWRWTAQRVSRSLTISVRLPPVRARFVRMVVPFTQKLHGSTGNQRNGFRLSAEDRIALWELKAGFALTTRALEQPDRYAGGFVNEFLEQGTIAPPAASGAAMQLRQIVDLTTHTADGTLRWTAPSGRWVILRIGYTLADWKNHTSSPEGRGYNANMFLASAMDLQFAAVLKKVMQANPGAAPHTLTTAHMDSSECGAQNWSHTLPAEFETRCGYSMIPWMPAVCGGRIVESADATEKFLWDLRRVMADLIAENYWGRFGELAHRNGLQFTAEASGRMQFLNDPLLYLSKADVPMGEFWVGEKFLRPDCAHCRSTANTLGKRVVMAESYTSFDPVISKGAGQWKDHPYSLKALGDKAFAAGINHFVFHRYLAQPSVMDRPGFAWGDASQSIGINMERTNTWWQQAAAWMSYLSRSQQLLQRGRAVADVCILMDEGVPNHLVMPQDMPSGFHCDGLHYTLLPQMTVKAGELVLPSGMRYRMLVLPPSGQLRASAARELVRLSTAGATLVGFGTFLSPSLADAVHQHATIAPAPTYASVAAAVQAMHLRPDFEGHDEVLFYHRRDAGSDIYFLSNQSQQPIAFDARFRIEGRAPELFDADAGTTTEAAVYDTSNGITRVPLTLDPSGSVFVLFQRPGVDAILSGDRLCNTLGTDADRVLLQRMGDGSIVLTAATSGSLSIRTQRGRLARLNLAALPSQLLTQPWTVSFPAGLGAPAEITLDALLGWDKHPDEGVRHFSGTATYRCTFSVDPDVLGPQRAAFLDLGHVDVIAQATLNGRALGIRWKPPFRYDVTYLLRAGSNTLNIAVTNLWPNRLIGDSALPAERRITRTNFNPYRASSPLFPSGLQGPVKLTFAHRRTVRFTES